MLVNKGRYTDFNAQLPKAPNPILVSLGKLIVVKDRQSLNAAPLILVTSGKLTEVKLTQALKALKPILVA